jgi:hypothetical protein
MIGGRHPTEIVIQKGDAELEVTLGRKQFSTRPVPETYRT